MTKRIGFVRQSSVSFEAAMTDADGFDQMRFEGTMALVP